MAMQILCLMCDQVLDTHARLQTIDRSILVQQRTNEVARRLYRPYLALARSVPQRWQPRLLIQVSSARVESLPPGSG